MDTGFENPQFDSKPKPKLLMSTTNRLQMFVVCFLRVGIRLHLMTLRYKYSVICILFAIHPRANLAEFCSEIEVDVLNKLTIRWIVLESLLFFTAVQNAASLISEGILKQNTAHITICNVILLHCVLQSVQQFQ